ncbi:hypothetical protein ACOM2C_16590 [Pseudarthrobacter sp. So.54]
MNATATSFTRIMSLMLPLMTATNEHLRALPTADQRVVTDFLDAAQRLMRDHLHALSEKDAR